MNYEPLKDTLQVGDKIACSKHYIEAEVLEVFKVDGECVYCMRNNGNAVTDPLTVQLLRDYDYQLITGE